VTVVLLQSIVDLGAEHVIERVGFVRRSIVDLELVADLPPVFWAVVVPVLELGIIKEAEELVDPSFDDRARIVRRLVAESSLEATTIGLSQRDVGSCEPSSI
jgi:hypothetical protein